MPSVRMCISRKRTWGMRKRESRVGLGDEGAAVLLGVRGPRDW